jgi:hypothetical protein
MTGTQRPMVSSDELSLSFLHSGTNRNFLARLVEICTSDRTSPVDRSYLQGYGMSTNVSSET